MIARDAKKRKQRHDSSNIPTSLEALKSAADASIRYPECEFGGTLTAVCPYNASNQTLSLEVQDDTDKTRKARITLVGQWVGYGGSDVSSLLRPPCQIAFNTTQGSEYRPTLDTTPSDGPYKLSFGGVNSNKPRSKIHLFVKGVWRIWEDVNPAGHLNGSTINHLTTSAPSSPEGSNINALRSEKTGSAEPSRGIPAPEAFKQPHQPAHSAAPTRPNGLNLPGGLTYNKLSSVPDLYNQKINVIGVLIVDSERKPTGNGRSSLNLRLTDASTCGSRPPKISDGLHVQLFENAVNSNFMPAKCLKGDVVVLRGVKARSYDHRPQLLGYDLDPWNGYLARFGNVGQTPNIAPFRQHAFTLAQSETAFIASLRTWWLTICPASVVDLQKPVNVGQIKADSAFDICVEVVSVYSRFSENRTLAVTDYTQSDLWKYTPLADRQTIAPIAKSRQLSESTILPLVCWLDQAQVSLQVEDISKRLEMNGRPIYVKVSNGWCGRTNKGNPTQCTTFALRSRQGAPSSTIKVLEAADPALKELLDRRRQAQVQQRATPAPDLTSMHVHADKGKGLPLTQTDPDGLPPDWTARCALADILQAKLQTPERIYPVRVRIRSHLPPDLRDFCVRICKACHAKSDSDRCKNCSARCEYIWRFALLLEDDLSYCGALLKLDKHHQRLVAIVSGNDASKLLDGLAPADLHLNENEKTLIGLRQRMEALSWQNGRYFNTALQEQGNRFRLVTDDM